jgi:anti-anti-sigma regulatory factor
VKILVRKKENGTVFMLLGMLTGQNDGTMFMDEVRKTIQSSTTHVIFDFNESSLPDSRFLGKMIELFHENKRKGIKTYLIGGKNEDIVELFKIAYIDKIMPLIQSEDDIMA